MIEENTEKKINAIFAKNMELLKNIRKFTEEELTFRTFTMFNFWVKSVKELFMIFWINVVKLDIL